MQVWEGGEIDVRYDDGDVELRKPRGRVRRAAAPRPQAGCSKCRWSRTGCGKCGKVVLEGVQGVQGAGGEEGADDAEGEEGAEGAEGAEPEGVEEGAA